MTTSTIAEAPTFRAAAQATQRQDIPKTVEEMTELRDQLAATVKQIGDDARRERRGLSDPERRVIDNQNAKIDLLEGRIVRQQQTDQADATFAAFRSRPVLTREHKSFAAQQRTQAAQDLRDAQQLQRDIDNGVSIPSHPSSNDETRNWLPGIHEYRSLQAEQRAVGTTGAFIPVEYYDRFFDQLRKRVGVLDAGPIVIPVDHAGSIKVPVVNSSVTVGMTAEAGTITPSDPGLGSITLDPKKLTAMTLVNSEAMEDSRPDLRTVVANSLVKDMAVELDRQFLVGDGTGQNMTGLINQSGTTAGASLGTNGASLAFGHLADTLGAYDQANLDPDKAAWLMHARTWASVRKIVDSQGRPIFSVDPVNGLRATIWGKPVFISNNLPINQTVGTSSDCSTILLADFSQVAVAVARTLELQMSYDFAFDKDQVALRATCRYDIGLPQPTAVVKTVGVRP